MQFLGHAIRSILLAEDDRDDQEMLEAAFGEIDPTITIVGVPNGGRLITHLRHMADADLPSLIILDYNLPEMNGSEILTLLGEDERFKDIPKVIWSTSASPVYRSICMRLGARDYIVKPGDMASYLSVARYMLTLIGEPML